MATNKSKSMDKMPARKMPKGFKMELKATAKATPKSTAKPKITKVEKQIARELSPAGMKDSAKKQSDALDKKYPGLYKKKAK